MTLLQWFILFLAVQAVHFAGTWKLYEKAGRKRWEAAVPVYNAVVLMQIINRPRWWVILLFIPVVNLIMFPVVWVQTLRAFGKRSSTDTILGIVTLGLYVYAINYNDKVTYSPEGDEERKDSTVGSLLFAIVVATIVHTYVMQPFTIPTASLEKTLLVGDYLFVSKFNYGARTPMTPIAAPMVHDTIPVINTKSYSSWPQLPYFRFPGFEKVEKNDIVVFNWPTDTVTSFRDQSTTGLRKPIDKKTNYVKRCVGTPGDNISVKNGIVYIDGKELLLSDRARPQYIHTIYAKADISVAQLQKYGVEEFYRTYKFPSTLTAAHVASLKPYIESGYQDDSGTYILRTGFSGIPPQVIEQNQIPVFPNESKTGSLDANLTLQAAAELRKDPQIDSIARYIQKEGDPRIYSGTKGWNQDNMGPIHLPKEGETIELNSTNLPIYKLIITDYENNKLEIIGGQITINGQTTNKYTFKQDYYWMMGDNRHNSLDSRFWGFVPADHIVGKPVFVWLSVDQKESWKNISKKIRWDRMFTTVGGDGEPVSYFKYFVVVLVLWFGFSFFRKRRNKAEKA